MKCAGKDRHLNQCRQKIANSTQYCKNHQYMAEYSKEQLEKLVICSGCKKAVYLENKTRCNKCINRKKNVTIENQIIKIKCAHVKCNSKSSSENRYCMKHQLCVWVDSLNASNKVPCSKYTRGCRNALPKDSEFKNCELCRKKEKEKYLLLREKTRLKNTTQENSVKSCTTCGKTYNLDAFIGMRNTVTITCNICRDRNKVQDSKRDKERRRELGRIYDAKPERKNRAVQWKEKNWEKVVKAWKNYRKRQKEKDEKTYLLKNSVYAKEWRLKHPESVKAQYQKIKESKEKQYRIYIQSAKFRNIVFQIDFNTYCIITEKPCNYCGIINEKRGFHGIDRKDSNTGYCVENCVACCSMCNYMKNNLSETVFSNRIETILVFNKMIENGNQYPDNFKNYNSHGTSFKVYSKRAITRNINFEITSDYFNLLIQEDCYLCGKKSTTEHCNGVDRINNRLGYTIENTRACCGNCNYMKNYYSLERYKTQLLNIYNNWISKSKVESET